MLEELIILITGGTRAQETPVHWPLLVPIDTHDGYALPGIPECF